MNDAHYHLIVNHLPIVGLLIGILVLIAGLVFNKTEVKLTALGILIFSAITSIAAFYTGGLSLFTFILELKKSD